MLVTNRCTCPRPSWWRVDTRAGPVSSNEGALTSGALSTVATVTEIVAALLHRAVDAVLLPARRRRYLAVLMCRMLPRAARIPVARAGHYSWHTLVSYVRATVLVAFVDAVGIGIGLLILRVPLALPLAALVFLGAFIPVVGATLSGGVAVLVALVAQGPISALIVLGIVIAVQQLEGHVLQPLLMGRAVSVHPLAVSSPCQRRVTRAAWEGWSGADDGRANTGGAYLVGSTRPGEPTPIAITGHDPRQTRPVGRNWRRGRGGRPDRPSADRKLRGRRRLHRGFDTEPTVPAAGTASRLAIAAARRRAVRDVVDTADRWLLRTCWTVARAAGQVVWARTR